MIEKQRHQHQFIGVSNVYDGDGRRVAKLSGNPPQPYKLYWYGMSSLDALVETDGAGNNATEYVFFGGKRVARREASGAVFYYFADHLGSSRVVTNSTGQILDDSDFYPFGGERVVASGGGNTYKFTGKERDPESGLDYFIARYYASALGRFASADPKGILLRHLLNPQKLNKYSYVLNNPLSFFDPNGMEEVTITFRTFIPWKSITFAGRTFAGDDRTFSLVPNASSRTSIVVKIETDPSRRVDPRNPIVSVAVSVGQTKELDSSGNVIRTGTATTGLPTVVGKDVNGSVVLNIKQAVKNPLTPQMVTPAIDADLTITVPQDASSVSVKGTIDDFPAAELNVTREDGNTTAVIQHQPPPGATPLSLFPSDKKVDIQKATPQCSTDEKGQKVCSQ